MNNWVILDPSQFKISSAQGMDVRVSFSPYDFPTAVRAYWDETVGAARVEFQYLTEEKTEALTINDHVMASVGQKSKRLYGLRIDTQSAGVGKVSLTCEVLRDAVKQAFDRLKTVPDSQNRPDRYRLAEDAIHQNSDQLFSFA
jgi:hypothetical protein